MSDGTDTPLELLNKVLAAGFHVFSVTDHDDLKANAEILSALKSDPRPIKFITGAEFSSLHRDRNLHLLCYGFDPENSGMQDLVAAGRTLRKARIAAMLGHLDGKYGITIPDDVTEEILARTIPGKIHILAAAAALDPAYNLPPRAFFDRYLDMDDRGYKIPSDFIIDAVIRAGGRVSFAHPVETQREYGIDFDEIGTMAKDLKDEGLAAIEVFHSLHGEREIAAYREIAKKLNLAVSGGSDYHGNNKTVLLGQLSACGYIPSVYEITLLDEMFGGQSV